MYMLVSLLVASALWWALNRTLRSSRSLFAVDIFFAGAFALAHFVLYPASVIYDDGGIVLKYMDNFAAGHFYCYNIEDGPVYGISGFLHGIFAGALAYFHILSPDHALLASNLAGLFLLALALLRVMRVLLPQPHLIFSCWILSLLMSRYLLITAKQGLETPLHLAVVVAGFLFMLRGYPRRFWLTCALMVISKLDALPIACVLGVAFVLPQHKCWLPLSLRNPLWRNAALWAGLPALVWLIFSTAVFGSVMPQTAKAKLLFAQHEKDSWFPFLLPLFQGKFAVFTSGLLALFAIHTLTRLFQRKPLLILRECSFGLAALAFLALFYFYNPREQMPWYYTLPDLFLVTQALLTLHLALSRFPARLTTFASVALLAGYALALWPDMSARIRAHGRHFDVIENERIAVGHWIYENSKSGDGVLCGYGHIARECHRYVIDYSGLNSRSVIDLRLDTPGLTRHFKPEWVVMQELMSAELAAQEGYRLAASFFNIATPWATSEARGGVIMRAWRVYQRDPAAINHCDTYLDPARFQTDGRVETNGAPLVTGKDIRLRLDRAEGELDLGFAHADQPATLAITLLDSAGSVLDSSQLMLPALKETDFQHGYTTAARIPIPAGQPVAAVRITSDTTITLLDPAQTGIVFQ